MADTIPDVTVSEDAYVDINDESGIAAGTALILENKANTPIRIQIAGSQPSASSVDGSILTGSNGNNPIKFITAGENIVWAQSVEDLETKLNVQDNT